MRYIWALVAVSLALAQQTSEKKTAPPPAKKEEPLFKNKIGMKSSEQTKESASNSFNGIDPKTGKVDAKMHAATATAAHTEKVKKMGENRPTEPQVMAFIKEGGLKAE